MGKGRFMVVLTGREFGAGIDPETGLPVLIVEGLKSLDPDEDDDRRYLIEPKAAKRVACALLFASDPELAEEVLRLVVELRGPTPRGKG